MFQRVFNENIDNKGLTGLHASSLDELFLVGQWYSIGENDRGSMDVYIDLSLLSLWYFSLWFHGLDCIASLF